MMNTRPDERGLEEAPPVLLAPDSFRWTETKWIVDLANGQTGKPATQKAAVQPGTVCHVPYPAGEHRNKYGTWHRAEVGFWPW